MKEYLNPLPYRNISSEHEFTDKDDYKKWNKSHFTRVYPKNVIQSTNYDFGIFLKKNCQFVTINYQTNDKYYYKYIDIFSGHGIILQEEVDLLQQLSDEEEVYLLQQLSNEDELSDE